MTCEELALAKGLFVSGLGLEKVFFADRRPGAADGPLLTAERAPNGRGVLEAGFAPRLPTAEEIAAADVLLVFGPYLAEHFGEEALAAVWAGVRSKFLFSSHTGPLDKLADIVFPVAVPAERSGTYINIDGTRQTFAPAVAPAAGVAAEGAVLARLADLLALDPGGGDAR
jgi:NADH dehydrogenase/NADH:ubiquinone oxidoreductase subunit G